MNESVWQSNSGGVPPPEKTRRAPAGGRLDEPHSLALAKKGRVQTFEPTVSKKKAALLPVLGKPTSPSEASKEELLQEGGAHPSTSTTSNHLEIEKEEKQQRIVAAPSSSSSLRIISRSDSRSTFHNEGFVAPEFGPDPWPSLSQSASGDNKNDLYSNNHNAFSRSEGSYYLPPPTRDTLPSARNPRSPRSNSNHLRLLEDDIGEHPPVVTAKDTATTTGTTTFTASTFSDISFSNPNNDAPLPVVSTPQQRTKRRDSPVPLLPVQQHLPSPPDWTADFREFSRSNNTNSTTTSGDSTGNTPNSIREEPRQQSRRLRSPQQQTTRNSRAAANDNNSIFSKKKRANLSIASSRRTSSAGTTTDNSSFMMLPLLDDNYDIDTVERGEGDDSEFGGSSYSYYGCRVPRSMSGGVVAIPGAFGLDNDVLADARVVAGRRAIEGGCHAATDSIDGAVETMAGLFDVWMPTVVANLKNTNFDIQSTEIDLFSMPTARTASNADGYADDDTAPTIEVVPEEGDDDNTIVMMKGDVDNEMTTVVDRNGWEMMDDDDDIEGKDGKRCFFWLHRCHTDKERSANNEVIESTGSRDRKPPTLLCLGKSRSKSTSVDLDDQPIFRFEDFGIELEEADIAGKDKHQPHFLRKINLCARSKAVEGDSDNPNTFFFEDDDEDSDSVSTPTLEVETRPPVPSFTVKGGSGDIDERERSRPALPFRRWQQSREKRQSHDPYHHQKEKLKAYLYSSSTSQSSSRASSSRASFSSSSRAPVVALIPENDDGNFIPTQYVHQDEETKHDDVGRSIHTIRMSRIPTDQLMLQHTKYIV